MKRLLLLLIFLIVFVSGAFSQNVDVNYKIVGHEIDFMKLQKSVQSEIDDGFTPLGLTEKDGKLYILYLSDNVMQMEAWKISRYQSIEDMDDGIGAMIKEGWFPAGFASVNLEYYTLYLETGYKAVYYIVKDSEIDSPKLQLEFSPFLRGGTIPMDLDIIGDLQIYLSAQMTNMPADEWKQVSFEFEDVNLNDKIAAEMIGRYLPWGLDITDGVLRINFIKFK